MLSANEGERACDEAAIATQGEVEFPAEAVYPNEQVVYQARHSCEPGGFWGSTAFLHMF